MGGEAEVAVVAASTDFIYRLACQEPVGRDVLSSPEGKAPK
jgi:hypothetical protein